MNRAVVGQPSWLSVLRASLPAEHLGGRDAAQTDRLEACPLHQAEGESCRRLGNAHSWEGPRVAVPVIRDGNMPSLPPDIALSR